MLKKHIFTAKIVKDLYLLYKDPPSINYVIRKYEKWAKGYVLIAMNPKIITMNITQGNFLYYTLHPDGYRINFKMSSIKYHLEVFYDFD